MKLSQMILTILLLLVNGIKLIPNGGPFPTASIISKLSFVWNGSKDQVYVCGLHGRVQVFLASTMPGKCNMFIRGKH